MLRENTPYLLRQDGKILNCEETCMNKIHPYVIRNLYQDKKYVVDTCKTASQDLIYFRDNSNNKLLKNHVNEFLSGNYSYDLCRIIHDESNEEFCRFRTSNCTAKMIGNNIDYKSIYFRISSKNFNWFDAIWKLVCDNMNFITTVTIMRDPVTIPDEDVLVYYKHKGKEIKDMPVDEFLCLSGNPKII